MDTTPVVQIVLLDGAAIVNMLRPGFANTFYVSQVFLSYITLQLQHVNRLDVVWDEYIADSLKAETRTRRGKRIRRRVEPSNSIPRNWQAFLRINDNKTEFFRSWRLEQQPLPPTNKLSAHVTLVCCVLSPETCQALLHAPMKKLVENYCAEVAIRNAWDYVSASRQDFNALLFTTVVDCVLVVNVRHSKH